jgi:hypothetical protein
VSSDDHDQLLNILRDKTIQLLAAMPTLADAPDEDPPRPFGWLRYADDGSWALVDEIGMPGKPLTFAEMVAISRGYRPDELAMLKKLHLTIDADP